MITGQDSELINYILLWFVEAQMCWSRQNVAIALTKGDTEFADTDFQDTERVDNDMETASLAS